jgi:hypothetical protein
MNSSVATPTSLTMMGEFRANHNIELILIDGY